MRFPRTGRRPATDHRVVHLAASMCLNHPDTALYERLELLRAGLAEQRSEAAAELARFVEYAGATDPAALAAEYVDLFDLSQRHTLYLSYWSDGDTRRRGESLAAFKTAYRDGGFVVDLGGELPDHLPVVLEFAARVDPEAGTALLTDYRGALDLIRAALAERGSAYEHVLAGVCATLPAADRRLLPLQPVVPELVGMTELPAYGTVGAR